MNPKLLTLLLLTTFSYSYAQHPVIFSVDRVHAAPEEVVTIQGSDFGTDPNSIAVFFGGTRAEVKSVINQKLEVYMPTGATFDPVRVVHTASGRSATAPGQFFLNYSGKPGLAADEFSSPQSDFQAEDGLYDLCLCDFDNDGKVDIATANSESINISVLRNTSSPGAISFNTKSELVHATARTLHVRCGDLNNDGRPDIVLTEANNGSRIFVLTNDGSMEFTPQVITLTGAEVKQVEIADLDLDGRPDLVVTNAKKPNGNITLLPNTTNSGTIAFGTPISIAIPGESSDALALGDLNNDGYPEIVSSQFQTDLGNELYIFENQGSLNFNNIKRISVNTAVSGIRIADLDGDTKPDIAITRFSQDMLSVYLNNFSGGALEFRNPQSFATGTLPVGIDFSDFDGDGKLDISVGAVTKSVSVFNNTTATPGTVSFAPEIIKLNVTQPNRHIRNADIDGDGKPDIIFTSLDNGGVKVSKISVVRNLSCMVPAISPGGPVEICAGSSLELKATSGGGISYTWLMDDVDQHSGVEENIFEATTAGKYKVVASSSDGCLEESNEVVITSSAPTVSLPVADPHARSNGPVCDGSTLQLEVDDIPGVTYQWRGPEGFAPSATASTLVERTPFAATHAGWYIVDVLAGTCVARTDYVHVQAVILPDFAINYHGTSRFCSDGDKTLTITPFLSDYNYQWHEESAGAIADAITEDFVATVSGRYYVVITPDNPGAACAPLQTDVVVITAVDRPAAGFQSVESACVGEDVGFVQQSTGAPDADLVYSWTFGDGKTSGEASPATTYTTSDAFEISLRVSYAGVESCDDTFEKTIDILAAPLPDIQASAMAMCDGETVDLSVSGSFAGVEWSTGESGPGIAVSTPGTYTVTIQGLNGCSGSGEITISQKPLPQINVTADRQAIAAGQKVQLQATGADEYAWSPEETLSDPTIPNPEASPKTTTTYTVEGFVNDGCSATATITIQVNGEVMNIFVPVLFSPNGDGDNESLAIEGIENYPDCTLSIFDKRGGRVFGTTGYQNNWDGTYKGAPLPDGIYYYVVGCPNSKAVTGTVTIIR